MKTVIMCAIAMAAFFGAQAQTGSVLVGGDVNFNSIRGSNSDIKSRNLSFRPYVGYQFNEKWTAGIGAGVNAITQKDVSTSNYSKTRAYTVNPFIRYTKQLSNLFSVYGQLQGGYGSYKSKFYNGVVTVTANEGNVLGANLFPAVFINLKNNFGLNFNIGGISYNIDNPKPGSTTRTFNVNFGQTGSIGISKNFGGKK